MQTDKPVMKTVRASGDWTAPVRVDAKAGNYPGFVMDQPEAAGGTGKGPNPMELLLAALVGCEVVTMVQVAREMEFQFSGFHCEVEGDMDLRGFMGAPGVCRYYCGLRGTVTVETDESQERLDMVRDQVESRCPVYTLLEDAGVPMDLTWHKAGELPTPA